MNHVKRTGLKLSLLVGRQTAVLNFTTTSVSASYAGLILDNVQIDATEPGSVILVGLGVGCLALTTKRLRRQQ
jgi:hypothetical protein